MLIYDSIAKCLGTDDKSKIDEMVSVNHQIKMVDLDNERRGLYKGLLFLFVGMFILILTVYRK